MSKRLQTIVKECLEILEKDVLTHTPSARLSRVDDIALAADARATALALFIELALLRCVEVRTRGTTSIFSARVDWDGVRAGLYQERFGFQAGLPWPLSWGELCGLTLSETALAAVSRHLVDSISHAEWHTDHILGWIYESFQAGTAEQKQYGRFYTPETIARAIVEQAFELAPCPLPTILDLGCGCGAFALQAFERLFQEFQAAGRKIDNPAARILAHHLFLIDSDPWACQIAALSLYLKALDLDPACRPERLNIVCADALQRWEAPEQTENFEAKKLFTRQYDLVIGNPPYGMVKQLRMPAEQLRVYRSYRTAAYKINTFPLFVERGIDLLKLHGVLGMVVPNTVLTQMYFEPLRRYILETCKIARILDTKRVFASAFVENCILILERDECASGRSEHRIACIAEQWQTGDSSNTDHAPHHICQRHFERAPFVMFQVHRDEGVRALLEQIAHDAPRLGDICESHDGVNPGNAKGKLIVADKLDAACRKVLNGKNIQRYQLHWDGLYVRYDRALLCNRDNVRWGHREALDSAKILTRQTADRIIGTFDAGEYYVTNSIHTTVMRPEFPDMSLEYVLAVLNSKLMAWYYRTLFPEVGQVFSQVKLVNLRQLPVRLAPPDTQAEIVALVAQLLHGASDRKQDLDDRLDALVYAAYALSPDQIRQVEQAMTTVRNHARIPGIFRKRKKSLDKKTDPFI